MLARATVSRGRGRNGFTALELMFAMTVMTIGLIAAFGGQIGTQKVMRQSKETQLVLTRLETLMEYAHSRPADELPVDGLLVHGEVAAIDDDFGLRDLEVVANYVDYEEGEVPPDPLHFTLTATWTDFERRQRTITLASVVTR